MNILQLLTLAIIWGFGFLFASVFGVLVGSFTELLIAHWAFGPGFVIGFIVFLYYIRHMLFFYDERFKISPPVRKRSSFLPFLIGLWLGKEMMDDND